MNGTKVLCWLALAFMARAYSYDNFCIDKRWPSSRPSAYCQGVVIPAYKTRNFISEELLCGSGNQTKTRTPAPFDEEKWRDLHNVDPGAAKDMLRALPVPQWDGIVKYDSFLHWSWEDCQLVTSYSCGSEQVCWSRKKDDGTSVEDCRDDPKTCYMDVVVNESEFCSHEQLTYEVHFQRADENSNYLDRLANGFDLLPGEEEGVTVDNGIGLFRSSTLSPGLSFVEPRNNYQVDWMHDNSTGKTPVCRQHSHYHAGFTVLPKNRIRSRSGNAFSLPTSFDGEKISPLVWQRAKNSEGHWQDKGYPAVLRVQDYSATSMSEFAQDINDIFKNVVVRIELHDKSTLGWPFARNTVYVEEGKGVTQTLNALSDNQKIRRSHLWELMLATQSMDPRKNLYRNYIPWFAYYPARLLMPAEALTYENKLSPGTDYQLRLTVYQKGLSIYHQACEDDPEAWDCRFYAGGGWFSPTRYESGYFSDKSLDIDFTTLDDVNQRSYWPMFWNTVSAMGNTSFLGMAAYGALRLISRH